MSRILHGVQFFDSLMHVEQLIDWNQNTRTFVLSLNYESILRMKSADVNEESRTRSHSFFMHNRTQFQMITANNNANFDHRPQKNFFCSYHCAHIEQPCCVPDVPDCKTSEEQFMMKMLIDLDSPDSWVFFDYGWRPICFHFCSSHVNFVPTFFFFCQVSTFSCSFWEQRVKPAGVPYFWSIENRNIYEYVCAFVAGFTKVFKLRLKWPTLFFLKFIVDNVVYIQYAYIVVVVVVRTGHDEQCATQPIPF